MSPPYPERHLISNAVLLTFTQHQRIPSLIKRAFAFLGGNFIMADFVHLRWPRALLQGLRELIERAFAPLCFADYAAIAGVLHPAGQAETLRFVRRPGASDCVSLVANHWRWGELSSVPEVYTLHRAFDFVRDLLVYQSLAHVDLDGMY